ncbi:hypothetical protein [Myxococcus sp. Y35]|uniref:hypothetical protein n=1 Tax=Pseudomyxococcus flavus TaxID=3115648 RepID=UPI003CEBAF36
MHRSEQLGLVMDLAEIVGPLGLGILYGVLGRMFLVPKLMPLLGRAASVVHSPANVFFSYVGVGLWLGLAVACHSWNAPTTLAWLQAHPVLPIEPTPTVLRVVYFCATFLTGSGLATLPSSSSELEAPCSSGPDSSRGA